MIDDKLNKETLDGEKIAKSTLATDEKTAEQTTGKKKLTKKQKIIIGCAAGILFCLILTLVLLFVFKNKSDSEIDNYGSGEYTSNSSYSNNGSKSSKSKSGTNGKNSQNDNENSFNQQNDEYSNTLSLINLYVSHNEYDRALDLIDSLLIKNGNNGEVLNLMDEIITKRSEYQQSLNAQNGSGYPNNSQDNTSKLEEALSSFAKMNQESTQTLSDMLKRQAENEQIRKEQAEQEKAVEEARQKKAAEEEKAKKVYEEQLAKKTAELKMQMDTVQDGMSVAKNQLSLGDIDSALAAYEEAKRTMPTAEKAYAGAKFNEMATELFDNYQTNPALSATEKSKVKAAASEYSNDALTYDKSQSNSHYIQGKLALENGDTQSAEKKFTDAINNASDSDANKYLYYFELGKIQYNQKRYTAATNSFTNSAKLAPKFENAQYNLGMSYEKLNETDKALAAYRKATAIKSDYARAHLQIARLLSTKKNDPTGAINSYLTVLTYDSTNSAAMREIGAVYSEQNNNAKAEEYFKKSLTYSPNDEQTMYNLSTVLYNQQKYTEANKYAKDAALSNNANATYYYNYALTSEAVSDIDSAITYYNKAIEKDSKMAKAYINLGKIFLENELADKALALLLKAVSLDSNSFEALNNLGSTYLELEQYKNAVDSFNKAIKLDSKNITAKLNLGKAYAKSTEYESAKQILMDVLKQDNKVYDAYIELAKVCTALNELDKAEGYLLTLQEIAPKYRKDEVEGLIQSLH